MIDKENTAEIEDWRRRLLDWFAANQRPLPWRATYAPYHVWISEIMGQQTQMERVAVYFSRWIEQFPDLASVATAPEQERLEGWLMSEVEKGAALPGLYPPNAENKARYEAWKSKS